MGTDALTAPGWLHQVAPTLQKGIISAVLPFVCPTPHAYSVNIMTQGGASGSPVFLSETGAVVGVLYGALQNFQSSLRGEDIYKVPTNISYVVPSHYIIHALNEVSKLPEMQPHPEALTIEDMIKQKKKVNVVEEGRGWMFRQVDPQAEAMRVSQINCVTPNNSKIEGG